MDEFTRRFRREIQRDARGRVRCAAELREEAASYLRARRDQGEPARILAERLGLSLMTVYEWMRQPPPAMREVEVFERELRGTAGAVMIMPSGVRIEGLAIADVAALLRALG